ncbi:uncharacterized protein EI90DRAFT_3292348 [Cantharellus anzutake]|uniref:uncharacterized protein n=1 Tax=Cantharellus anzutake TaxID=1750568 RepID=UPI0019034A4A|nr:uncharacterized protein EI90DRAFT_3292348 [Cantharellus anzutake]KAF8323463.1 hypothetical protein EI90DRAFT_3292348 [Cantharellus anzutake]
MSGPDQFIASQSSAQLEPEFRGDFEIEPQDCTTGRKRDDTHPSPVQRSVAVVQVVDPAAAAVDFEHPRNPASAKLGLSPCCVAQTCHECRVKPDESLRASDSFSSHINARLVKNEVIVSSAETEREENDGAEHTTAILQVAHENATKDNTVYLSEVSQIADPVEYLTWDSGYESDDTAVDSEAPEYAGLTISHEAVPAVLPHEKRVNYLIYHYVVIHQGYMMTKNPTVKLCADPTEALECAGTLCSPDFFDDGYKCPPEKDPDKVLSTNQNAGNELAQACESELTQVTDCILVTKIQVDICKPETSEHSLVIQEHTVVVREPVPDMTSKFGGKLDKARVRTVAPERAELKSKELRPPGLSDELYWSHTTSILVPEEITDGFSQVPAKRVELMTRERIAKRAKASGPSTPLDDESMQSFELDVSKSRCMPATEFSAPEFEVAESDVPDSTSANWAMHPSTPLHMRNAQLLAKERPQVVPSHIYDTIVVDLSPL